MIRSNTFGLVSALILGALLWSSAAQAQSVTISENAISRTVVKRDDATTGNWISRNDCLLDDELKLPLVLANHTGYQLEVWVGDSNSDCSTPDARGGSAPTCWLVQREVVGDLTTTPTISVSTRDIVAQNKSIDPAYGPGTGTEADCTPESATSAAQFIDLWVMLVSGTGNSPAVAADTWSTAFDLAGPPAPANVSLGAGETMLKVSFDLPADQDLVLLNYYCDPMPGQEPAPSDAGLTTMASDGSVDPDAFLDGALEADIADSGDAAPTEEAGPTEAGTDGAAEASAEAGQDAASVPASDCKTTVLVPGEIPPDDLQPCATSARGGSGKITKLQNGVTYTVAVAGVDAVGNVGKLSNLACAAPVQTDDFYDLYRAAGGKAGGGFCTASNGVGTGAGAAGLALLAAAALVSALRRRK